MFVAAARLPSGPRRPCYTASHRLDGGRGQKHRLVASELISLHSKEHPDSKEMCTPSEDVTFVTGKDIFLFFFFFKKGGLELGGLVPVPPCHTRRARPAATAGGCRLRSPPPRPSHHSAARSGLGWRVSLLVGTQDLSVPGPISAARLLQDRPWNSHVSAVRVLSPQYLAWCEPSRPHSGNTCPTKAAKWACRHWELFRKVGQFHVCPHETEVPRGFRGRSEAPEWRFGDREDDNTFKALTLGGARGECLVES